MKKNTKIDDIKGWTGTYQSVKSEINNLGYYSFSEFDSKLMKPYHIEKIEESREIFKPSEKKVHFSNDLAAALKEANFKPNKECRFKFDINRKDQSIQTVNDDILKISTPTQTNLINESFNFPILVGQIMNNKMEENEDYYEDPEDIDDEIYNVRSLIDDNIEDSEDISFSDERYDLLANLEKLESRMKIDRFCESDSEYIDNDDEFDYDNSKETFLQNQLKEESLLYEPCSRIEKRNIGKVTFIKKAWKCD
jgi:hypothetical protein